MIGFIPVGNETPCRRTPWVNRFLILANLLAFVLFALRPDYQNVVNVWGFRASDPSLITLLAAGFLHANFLHLFGNMLYLVVFGNSVEDRLGHLGYLAFYFGGMLLAAVVHTFSVSKDFLSVPCIGASGAVAATLGAYLLLFPTQRIKYWGFVIFRPVTFRLPAWLTLIWWFGLQAWEQMGSDGTAPVAYGAHIGGFITGFAVVGLLAISNIVTPSWASPEVVISPQRSAKEPAKRLPCPGCEGLMEDAGLASGVQRCLVCAAAWCPKGQLESLLKLRHLPPALERRELSETVIEHWTNCPTCDGPLVEIEAHGVPVRACAKCLGTLIPNGAFERIQSA